MKAVPFSVISWVAVGLAFALVGAAGPVVPGASSKARRKALPVARKGFANTDPVPPRPLSPQELLRRPGPEDTPPVPHYERQTDPPGILPDIDQQRLEPARKRVRGAFTSVQVNVDANGNNIIGDAANETSIAIDSSDPNRMVIGWRQFDTILSNFRTSGYSYSHDGGQNWTFPGVLEPGQFSSDPVLASDLNGNIFYYGLQPNRGPGEWACYSYRTSDAGLTWPLEQYAFGGDKAWVAIDSTSGIGSGNIYVAWSPFAGCCGSATFTRSTDSGVNFDTPISIPGDPFFGTLTVGPEGYLYVVGGVNWPDGPFMITRSTNARAPALPTPTFGAPVQIDLGGFFGFQTGPSPAGLLGQLWIVSDHSQTARLGNLYVLASVIPDSGSDPMEVMFSRSEDGGATWSAPIRINDDSAGTNAWQWFGTISIAPDGRLDVVWNDTRNDASATFSELYYASSDDGGINWSQNVPLSPPFNHFLGFPQQQKMGDYIQMLSDNSGASLAYAATFNGEQDAYFLRIPQDDCNGNGISDAEDIANQTSEDCNGNALPDECEPDLDCNENLIQDICDVAAGTSPDVDGDEIPDECSCPTTLLPSAPSPGLSVNNRFLSIIPPHAGEYIAIRVTATQMPAGFESLVGSSWWVGPPQEVSEVSGTRGFDPDGTNFWTAPLQCARHYADFGSLGNIDVYGEAVVPGVRFDIDVVWGVCDWEPADRFSPALSVSTVPDFGDIVGALPSGSWAPSDGNVDFDDISATVDRFRNVPTAPRKARVLIFGDLPKFVVDFQAISWSVDAFRGISYPFVAPPACGL